LYYIGLMSGTSMDAVDVAVADFDKRRARLIEYAEFPYQQELRARVRAISAGSDINEVTELDIQLGRTFADAILTILAQAHITPARIHAIGSHGQTVLHLPDAREPRTLQLGDPHTIANGTGLTTIADFRRMDMAAGGKGAPLAPAFHAFQFRSDRTDRVILNLGGIANITLLPADNTAEVTGFDTGPGNGLMDDWNYRHNKTNMDKDSRWAQTGQADFDLVKYLLDDPYFASPPPKSTGRDYFNITWLDNALHHYGKRLNANDVQASLLELTCTAVQNAIRRHADTASEIYTCGGGANNPYMIHLLRSKLPDIEISSTDKLGLAPNAVEAVTFAWLAYCRVNTIPVDLKSITGATGNTLLGAVYSASLNP